MRCLSPLVRAIAGFLIAAPLFTGCAVLKGPADPMRLDLLPAALPAAAAVGPNLAPDVPGPPSSDLATIPNVGPDSPPEPAVPPVPAPQPKDDVESVATGQPPVETGIASYYGGKFHGRRTASGEVFNMRGLSAAHRTLPLGTKVRVTNLDNDRDLVLTINDRGPFVGDRVIDLSREAARLLGFLDQGITRVRIDVLSIPTLTNALR